MRRSLLLLVTLGSISGCFGLQNNVSADTAFGDTSSGQFASTPTEVDLAGKLYVIAPSDLHLVEPAGLDTLFHEALKQNVLVYVADESSDTLGLQIVLASSDGTQDPCQDVRSLPDATWQNPTFDAGPGEVAVSFGGEPASLRHLRVTGTFDEYAFNWRDGTLSAQLDARELTAALGGADACELVENVGGACEACDDGAMQCITLRFEDVVAAQTNAAFDPTPTCN